MGGGRAAANALCQAEAAAAGLSGAFLAVLPTSTTSAASQFNTIGRPWVRSDGIPITETAAEFFSAALWNSAPNLSADRIVSQNDPVLFGGTSLEQPATLEATCSDWTSTTGSVAVSGAAVYASEGEFFRAFSNVLTCDQARGHLACLED